MHNFKVRQEKRMQKIVDLWKESTSHQGYTEDCGGLCILRLRDHSALCDSNFRTHTESKNIELLESLIAFQKKCNK